MDHRNLVGRCAELSPLRHFNEAGQRPTKQRLARIGRSVSRRRLARRLLVEQLECRDLLATFTVINNLDSSAGSLRWAIGEANANAGFDIINFAIPGGGVQTIAPLIPFAEITDEVAIDGSSQAGSTPTTPMIEIDGTRATQNVSGSAIGLDFRVGGNIVQGLVINNFSGAGIHLNEPGPTAVGGSTIRFNFLGTDASGTLAKPNSTGLDLGGSFVESGMIGSPNNIIVRNLISGNRHDGVEIDFASSSGNTLEGNLIGTDITGMHPLGNGLNGVSFVAPDVPFLRQGNEEPRGYASNNTIDGTVLKNVISGNKQSGVYIFRGSNNTVKGNFIGVAVDGVTPLPNGANDGVPPFGSDGVFIEDGDNNRIGGAAPGEGNLISGNVGSGVRITSTGTGNQIQGNWIGTKSGGLEALPNQSDGVTIFTASGNTVGGNVDGARNIISGNQGDGIFIGGGASAANFVQGNLIGLDANGQGPLPNTLNGVELDFTVNNTIGGLTSTTRNIISGNLGGGVVIRGSGATGNLVQGNYIGTDDDGLLTRPNKIDGIQIFDSPTNVIGGTSIEARNIISGNDGNGIVIAGNHATANVVAGNYIGTNVTGTLPLPNLRNGVFLTEPVNSINGTGGATGNLIGGDVDGARNIISGNGTDGVQLGLAGIGNQIQGNYIGTTVSGVLPLPNERHGVAIFDSSSTIVGGLEGTKPGSHVGNVISGNKRSGVALSGVATSHASDNLVLGNFIGVDFTGTESLQNNEAGVLIESAANNTIGGANPDARNVISGNGFGGVLIHLTGAIGNRVLSNYIGVDVRGTGAVPNTIAGIFIDDVPGNLIGDGTSDGRNIISGNNGPGILVKEVHSTTTKIRGNFIGTDYVGETALANQGNGVTIFNAPNNFIGGTGSGEGNLISGNTGDGIKISGDQSENNRVQQNTVGTESTAKIELGNKRHGIELDQGANNNFIGGVNPGEGNTIAFNGSTLSLKGYGVSTEAGKTNSIRGNSIFANSGRGIDLVNLAAPDTFTINDFQSKDHPEDPVQDAPTIKSIVSKGTTKDITWTLNSTPGSIFLIDFYNATPIDKSGFGEGKAYLFSLTVGTDIDGNVDFTANFPLGGFISATTTDLLGNTSEFSMVDTDGDALADNWEISGIDIDEDGTLDLVLPGADYLSKDVYVEIDSMVGYAPSQIVLNSVALAFSAAPVLNPNNVAGIHLHAIPDETIDVQDWTGDLDGDGKDALGEDQNHNGKIDPGEDLDGDGKLAPGDPDDQDPFKWFNIIKNNGYHGAGGFGTSAAERANPAAMAARRLVYRYCLFAKSFASNITTGVGGTDLSVSGIAEIVGNDFMVTLGTWAGTNNEKEGTFMHEFGHSLGLKHGGGDHINLKPNCHSQMNYDWQIPADWMYEDMNANGKQDFNDINGDGVQDPGEAFVEFDVNGNGFFGDLVAGLNYSDRDFGTLNENNLDESVGIGGHPGDWTLAGPPKNVHIVPETGPVDWSQSDANHDGIPHNDIIKTGIDINRDNSTVLKGFDDWSNLHYYFGEDEDTASGSPHNELPVEMKLEDYESLNSEGPGPGVLEFELPDHLVSESGGTIDIVVTRGGGTHGDVTVDYSTADATAHAGEDYAAVSGSLTFADGEYNKVITVPILSEFFGERTESFTLLLSHPHDGATLGPRSSTSVDILDDDHAGFFVVTNTNDSGAGSLRQAILDANRRFGSDFIDFNLPGGSLTITPDSPLPIITDAVTIDGSTQPGFADKPIVELNGETFFADSSGLVVAASNVTIKGLVINRWRVAGIEVSRTTSFRPFNFHIEGNYLGTDVTGMNALPNRWGVLINDGNGVIGGGNPAARNVISGNGLHGVEIRAGFSVSVRGNFIGVGADGTSPLGNSQDGVLIASNGAVSTAVGGTNPGDGNIIAFNGSDGVHNSLPSNNNSVLSNSIYSNKTLGYNVGVGTTQEINDSGLTDTISSNPQNYPVLTSATSAAGKTTITGFLNSRPNHTYLLQFFSSPKTTASGYGEGETYLGSATFNSDVNGRVDFNVTLDVDVVNRRLITATATENNNTSEFSARLAVGDVLSNLYVVNTNDDIDDGVADASHTSLREAILATNNHPGPDTIQFAIGSGVKTIAPIWSLPPILDTVTIDATTQPGFAGTPIIELNGTNLERPNLSGSPLRMTGLDIRGDNNTIRGLVIDDFYEFGGEDTSLWGGRPLTVTGNNNLVVGNFIGTDVTGAFKHQNLVGLTISGNGNRIGGTAAADRNLLSGTQEAGLLVIGNDNIIQGNLVGTDVTGTKSISNGRGIAYGSTAMNISGANNLIGGTARGAGNVISGNLADALVISNAGSTVIQGNFIGTDITGTKALGNTAGGSGIVINDSTANRTIVGGPAPGARNIISNNAWGILGSNHSGDVIQGNYIGTDITGAADFGNLNDGIFLRGTGVLVGGTGPGEGNLISGNNRFGIFITPQINVPNTAQHNVIQGNRIGTSADGAGALGNGSDGICLAANFNVETSGTGVIDNLIGGTTSGAGNIIAFNGRNGINVLAGQQIRILSNSIFSNTSLGIDLNGDGITDNDAGDGDSGDNNLQNFPVLTSIGSDGFRTTVTGTLNSAASTTFRLQFFASDGEGQVFLGTRILITDAAGDAVFTFNFPTPVAEGRAITATATDISSNTSEFSHAVKLTSGSTASNAPPLAIAAGPYNIAEADSLTLDGSFSDDPDGDPIVISWDINDDGIFGDAIGVTPNLTGAQLQALGILNGPSTFEVRVRVDDGQGHVVTSSPTALTVTNVAPEVSVTASSFQVPEGDQLDFSGSFTDPGTTDTHTLNWHVVADNGQAIADGNAANFSFVPDDNGTYDVTFTVTDSDGDVGTTSVQVLVSNRSPTASIIGLPPHGSVGVAIHLTPAATDPSPVDTIAGFHYEWDVILESNGGVEFFDSVQDFSFTPPEPGVYDVYLLIRDKDGSQIIERQELHVLDTANNAPTASAGGPYTINEGGSLPLDALASSDPDGDPLSYSWDINGDGTFDDALGSTPTLTWQQLVTLGIVDGPSSFNVQVRVSDGQADVLSSAVALSVLNVAPVANAGADRSVHNGDPVNIDGTATDPGLADTHSFEWHVAADNGQNIPNVTGSHLTFVPDLPGDYTVSLLVTDDDSETDLATVRVTVTFAGCWQNRRNPLDVDVDRFVAPIDALQVINYLNLDQGPPELPAPPAAPPPYLDVNCDNFVSPIDALLIINDLNELSGAEGEPVGATARAVATDVNKSNLSIKANSSSPAWIEPQTTSRNDPTAIAALEITSRQSRWEAQLEEVLSLILADIATHRRKSRW